MNLMPEFPLKLIKHGLYGVLRPPEMTLHLCFLQDNLAAEGSISSTGVK